MLLGLLGAVAGGLQQVRFDTSVPRLFPKDDSTSKDYSAFQKKFGSEPISVLLQQKGKPGQLLTSAQLPNLLRLEGDLARLPDVAVVYGPATILNQIAAGAQNLLATISGARDGIRKVAEQRAKAAGAPAAQITAAGDRAIEPFDERYGVLLTQALPSGLPTLRNQAFINASAFGKDGQPRPELRFVVPNNSSAAILVRPRPDLDQAAEGRLESAIDRVVARDKVATSTVTVTGPSVVLQALAVDVQHQLPFLGAVAVLLVGAMLLLGHRQSLRNPRIVARLLVPLLSSLSAVVLLVSALGWARQPASLGLLTLLPVLLGVGTDVPVYLSRLGRSRRLVVAAVATASGFLTTALSPVPFVRSLGILLAAGVLLATAIAWFLPALPGDDLFKAAQVDARPVSRPRPSRIAMRVAAAVLLVAAASGWALLPQIDINADPTTLAGGLPALAQAQRSQQVLGATGEIDVVLSGDVLSANALAWSAKASGALISQHADALKPILSPSALLGFLGPTPTPAQIKAAVAILPAYLLSAAVDPTKTASVLSFGLRAGDLANQQALLDGVRHDLPPAPKGTRVTVTGVPVLASKQLTGLKGSRLVANVIGVGAPSLVLLLLLGWRRRRDSALAFVSAVVATGVGFLLMNVLGVSFTPLTLALGSLTAAVGCEFSVVLSGAATRAGGRGVLLAAGACFAGYLSLAASRLEVIRDFGQVLAVSVVLGYLTARLVCATWPSPTRDAPESQQALSGQDQETSTPIGALRGANA